LRQALRRAPFTALGVKRGPFHAQELAALATLLELGGRDCWRDRRRRDRRRRSGLLHWEEEPAHGRRQRAEAVHLLRHRSTGVLDLRVPVLVERSERLVHLDEPAIR